MKLGFIGTGALTAAIVTGLKSTGDTSISILLSPRNETISAGLAARFAGVDVAADNQAVLDGCDTVMLAVRPQIAQATLAALRFRPDHRVVSLIATLSPQALTALVAPAESPIRALPMPMVAHRQGPTILCPPDRPMAELFGRLGKAIEVEDGGEFDALGVVTANFATYFKYLETIGNWLTAHGVAKTKARDYTASVFKALASAPETAPDMDFLHLAEDYATRGGLNEQVLLSLTAHGVFAAVTESLDAIHARVTGSAAAASDSP